MGLFDRWRRRPKRTCVDPIFGTLEREGTARWRGRVFFEPVAQTVHVGLDTGDREPDEREHRVFRELARRYASMSAKIGDALLTLYVPFRDADPERMPDPSSSREMLSLTRLDWLDLSAGGVRLGYGFVEGAGWDDAMFTIPDRGLEAGGRGPGRLTSRSA